MKRIETNYSIILLCIIFILQSVGLQGQGWKKEYDFDVLDQAFVLLETQDNGFLLGGASGGTGPNGSELTLVKTDIAGTELWHKTYPFYFANAGTHQMLELADGSFMVFGSTENNEDMALLKINNSGDLLWSQEYDDSGEVNIGHSLAPSGDGGFILAGSTTDTACGCKRILLVKTDADGDLIWDEVLPGIHDYYGHSVQVLSNGEIVIGGYHASSGGIRMYLVKTSGLGQIIWEKEWMPTNLNFGSSVIQTNDGNLLFIGYQNGSNSAEGLIIKVDQSGNELWLNTLPGLSNMIPSDAIETTDQGFVLTGYYGQPNPGLNSFLLKVDSNGNELWTKTFDWYGAYDTGQAIVNTTTGGYAFAGTVNPVPGTNQYNMYLARTDTLGSVYSNYIEGKVFDDDDLDCQLGMTENGLSQWIVKAEKDGESFFAVSDSSGSYSMLVDTGAYEVSITPYAYWEPCQVSYPIQFSTFYNTTILNLPLQATFDCPFLEVYIGSPFLRFCAANTYHVQYCNYGTEEALGATVEVTLDATMTYQSATAPLISQAGNIYTFDVGDLVVGECGSFSLDFDLDCDSTLVGQTFCTEAHIFPDSICDPNLWTGPIIEVTGNCNVTEDSLIFTIKNVGADMQQLSEYIVIQDNIILFTGSTYQLNASQVMEVPIMASNGSTYHLLTGQGLGFPSQLGNPIASASVESCMGMASPGAYNQIPEDDGEPYLSVFCQEVIASFDPNDKRAFPSGWTTDHFIDETTDLEYYIRFQNTGTDTAFRVVILDTLSALLNPRSLRPGVASHEYEFEFLPGGVAQFTFDNIMLPDSNVNEAASHGFVSFRIDQTANNSVGSVIYNSAAIYFDFNAPVITNETFHTIHDPWIEIFQSATEEIAVLPNVMVYPNPFQHSARIELPDASEGQGRFTLYNLQGQKVRSIDFRNSNFVLGRDNLPAGIYAFEIRMEGAIYSSGKVVVGR